MYDVVAVTWKDRLSSKQNTVNFELQIFCISFTQLIDPPALQLT